MSKTEVTILSHDSQKDFISSWYELAQDTHFWMHGRLCALLKQFRNNHIPLDQPLVGLEIGCGHGVLRCQIEKHTQWTIDGTDLDLESLKNNPPCRGKPYLYNIFDKKESLKEHYDFIILYDVIEHIDNVKAFLEASIFHLKPGGYIFINVPALPSIYSNYDKFVGHIRRYDKKMMAQTIKEADLKLISSDFWGISFLPLLWARKIFLARDNQEDKIVQKGFNPKSTVMNSVLKTVITTEVAVFPFPLRGHLNHGYCPKICSIMITKILQAIFSVPFFYNQMQIFFGSNIKKGLVGRHYTFAAKDAVILDLGGGTGLYRDLWPKNYKYICLDNDSVKLNGLLKDHPQDTALIADAALIPLKDSSVDAVFCSSLSHHIPEEVLTKLLAEGARVLNPSGKFIFLDAVYRKESFLNRFLWSLDRGDHPHTEEFLLSCFKQYFNIETFERFSRYYDFVFILGGKKL